MTIVSQPTLISLYPADVPSAVTFTVSEGEAVPRPLVTVEATDVDGDTVTYAIAPASVSRLKYKN